MGTKERLWAMARVEECRADSVRVGTLTEPEGRSRWLETSSEELCRTGTHIPPLGKIEDKHKQDLIVHARLCSYSECIAVPAATVTNFLLPQFLKKIFESYTTPTAVVAERIINEKFEVEVHGRLIQWSPGALKRKKDEEWHRGTITSVLGRGSYEVQFKSLTDKATGKKTILSFHVSDLRFV